MALVQINWRPDSGDLRRFGAVILIGFCLIGLAQYFWPWTWPFSQNRTTGLAFICIGLLAGGLGLTGTKAAMPVYWLWMGFAFVLGNIMGRVVLGVVFFLAVTPLGLIGRLIGRDKLQLKKRGERSYWKELGGDDSKGLERQF